MKNMHSILPSLVRKRKKSYSFPQSLENKKKKYRVAIIGCGKIAVEVANYSKETQPATHAGAYDGHPKAKLVAFVDRDPERLKRAQHFFPGVALFTSAEEMLKTASPDIVSIATQSDSHAELVKLAVKYKTKGIVCEKPIADTLLKARQMVKAVKKGKSLVIINHMRRFDPLIQKWQGRIKAGLIGDILQGSCYYYNGLLNNGTHVIDLLRFFVGEVSWVRGLANKKTSISEKDQNVDAVLGFENGATVTLQTLPKNYGFLNFYFYGTKGRLVIKDAGYRFEYRKLISNENYQNFYRLSPPLLEEGGLRSFMRPTANHIINCVEGTEKPKDTVEDGFKALEIIEALRKSARSNGKIIKLKPTNH